MTRDGTGPERSIWQDTEPVTVREVLLLLLAAYRHPIQDNHDARVVASMEMEALTKVDSAIASPLDPPEFKVWHDALRQRPLSSDERADIYDALLDYFVPDEPAA